MRKQRYNARPLDLRRKLKDRCVEKQKLRPKITPRKVGAGLKRKGGGGG